MEIYTDKFIIEKNYPDAGIISLIKKKILFYFK